MSQLSPDKRDQTNDHISPRELDTSSVKDHPHPETIDHTSSVKTSSTNLPTRAGRYRIVGEVARGGMGAVLRAQDPDLDRTLAVKVMLVSAQERPDLEQRFLEEAQITGQLQHPGVPPVHELGRLEDGRAFFAMKLIDGRTLDDLLNERDSRPKSEIRNPKSETNQKSEIANQEFLQDLPKFLGIFEHICQTIAYAHSRGILHRDLKPLNVMVGAFGEVQVMDWGLAKVVRGQLSVVRGSEETEHVAIEDPITAPEDSVLADEPRTTPPRRRGQELRTHAGSILGTPAYMAPEQARGEIDKLDERCDVFGLGAILCRMLTGKPPFVGKNAAEVIQRAGAGDLTNARRRLQDCGLDAELIALAVKCLAPAKEDRHPNAGSVAEAISEYRGSVEARLRNAEIERAAQSARAEEALKTAEQESKARLEAQRRATEERKRRRLTVALAASLLITVVVGGGAWTWIRQQQDAIAAKEAKDTQTVNQRIESSLEKAKRILAESRAKPERELEMIRQASDEVKKAEALSKNRLAGSDLRKKTLAFVALLDGLAGERKLTSRLKEIRDQNHDSDIKKNLFVHHGAPNYAAALVEFGVRPLKTSPEDVKVRLRDSSKETISTIVAALDDWWREVDNESIRKWITDVIDQIDSDDPWRSQFRLARSRHDRRKIAQLADTVDVQGQPPSILFELAQDLDLGQQIALLRKAHLHHPSSFIINFGLWRAYRDNKQLKEAARFALAALAIRPVAGTFLNAGASLCDVKDYEGSVAVFKKLIKSHPKYALAYTKFGEVLEVKGTRKEAIAAYRKAIEVDPKFANYGRLGSALVMEYQSNPKGKKPGALNEAVEFLNRAIKHGPPDAPTHFYLARAMQHQGKWDEAAKQYRRAIEIDATDPTFYTNLATSLRTQDKLSEAEKVCRQGIAIAPRDGFLHGNLGLILEKQGKPDEAVDAYKKAIELDPKAVGAYLPLAMLLQLQGKWGEAVAVVRKGVAIDPNNDRLYLTIFFNRLFKGNADDEVIVAFEYALKLNPKHAYLDAVPSKVMNKLLHRLEELVGNLHKRLASDPKNAGSRVLLGNAYALQGKPKEAIKEYELAVQIIPAQAYVHLNLGVVLAEQDELNKSVAAFKEALHFSQHQGKMKHAAGVAWAHLARVLKRQGKSKEAIEAYRKSIAIRPEKKTNANLLIKDIEATLNMPTGGGKIAIAPVQGKLAKSDPMDNFPFTKKSYHKAHSVKLVQGKTYQIDLKGSFDTFLRIEDEKKKPLLFNDDAGPPSDLNSRLVFTPKTTQKFRLIVTSYEPGAVGAYSLQLREATPNGKPNIIEEKLTIKDRNKSDKFFKMHKVELTGGKAHNLVLESKDFDTFMVLLDAKSGRVLAQNGHVAPDNPKMSRIDFTPKTSGTYLVVITSLRPGQTGDYTLRVRRYELAKK